MADAIVPQGHLVVGYPYYDGLTTVFGLGRNWRFDTEWETRYCEIIEPLQALQPAGDKQPIDMDAADWTVNGATNTAIRTCKVRGTPVKQWWYFYDGDTYPAVWPCGLQTQAARFPTYALHTIRHSPPEGQGIAASIQVSHDCLWRNKWGQWKEAYLTTAYVKECAEHPSPFLHVVEYDDVTGDYFNVLTQGEILAEFNGGGSSSQGVDTSSWFFEPIIDSAGGGGNFSGTHFLIRNSADMGSWWHYYNPDIRLTESKWTVVLQGAKAYFNLSPIRYGANAAYAWPHDGYYLPSAPGSSWEPDITWYHTEIEIPGWTVGAQTFNAANAGDYWQDRYDSARIRPFLSMTRDFESSKYYRPIYWFASEQHDATIAQADTTTESTDGNADLIRLEYTQRQDWRGSSGSAEFRPEGSQAYSGWRENSKVFCYMGMQTGATTIAEALVATGYILPGGITRSRAALDGNQATLTVKFGDFVTARMPSKEELPDIRQGGGQTIDDSTSSAGRWASMICNRLGLPSTMLDVDSSVDQYIIPLSDPLPSHPSYDKADGLSLSQHMTEVCEFYGLRWGFDKDGDGKLFIDAGPGEYTDGVSTISFTLDEETATEIDVVRSLTYETNVAEWRNCLKAVVGSGDDGWTAYIVDSLTDRKAGVGDDWWSSLQDQDSRGAPALVKLWYDEHRKYEKVIVWESIIRPELRVDDFVKVASASYTGITADTVFQIIEHHLEIDKGSNVAKSTFTGVVVYEP